MPDAILDDRPLDILIRHYRGSTFSKTFGFNADLTGATARFTIRRAKTSSQHLTQKVIPDSSMTINPATPHSSIPVTISAADQTAWEAEKYFYDLEITFADGTNDTYIAGEFEVFKDIT